MVRVVDQDIPADFYRQYQRSLGFSVETFPGSGIYSVRKRQPFRLPHMKTGGIGGPSAAQLAVRNAFKRCVDCFNASPRTGGVEPPDIGYRSREWWFEQAAPITHPPYEGKEFATWDGEEVEPDDWKASDDEWHPQPWFLKTDEPDFIAFYDEMKTKYGYPWSLRNDPDQIVTKMNQIVCDEIDYDYKANVFVAYTPGETAKSRKGVCDDQSILHYALTWKALKELEWTDDQINNRLGVVVNAQEGYGHVYNWWKTHLGSTKIIENTYDPKTSPKVMGDMEYWGATGDVYLQNRFNKTKSYLPTFTANGFTRPLWYFNYFMRATFPFFYDDEIPDWCGSVVGCDHTEQAYLKHTDYSWGSSWEEAWNKAYAQYVGYDWEETEFGWDILNCYANAAHPDPDTWRALISCSKNTLVFKPQDFTTEAKWDLIKTIKIMFRRNIDNQCSIGGGIRCVETDETQDQVRGWQTFYLPKEICLYDEFSVTFEALCRTSTDLKPNEPDLYGAACSGCNSQISNAKLYCIE